MSEEPDNLTLRYLRRLADGQDGIKAELRELKAEVRGLKSVMAGQMQDQIVQDTALTRLQDRMDRVERRLDLHEEETK